MGAVAGHADRPTCIRGSRNRWWERPWTFRCPARLESLSFFIEWRHCSRRHGSGFGGGSCNRVRDLNKRHPQLKQHVLQERFFAIGKIALGLFLQDRQRVNRLPRANNVHAGRLVVLPDGSHLDQRAHVKRFNHALKIHLQRSALWCFACGGNHVVNFLAGFLVRLTLLVLLFRRGWRRHLFFLLGFWRSRLHLRLHALTRLCSLGRYNWLRWRRRRLRYGCLCRWLFLFRYLCFGPRFAFRPKPAAICYYKLCLFFSHSVLILFQSSKLFKFQTASPLLSLQRRLMQSFVLLQSLHAAHSPTQYFLDLAMWVPWQRL